MLNRNTWGKLITFEREFKRRGENYGRRMIAETLHVSSSVARLYEFALYNKDTIRYAPDTLDTSEGDRELVLTDIHIPYEDSAAVEAALSWGERQRPNIITLLGDIIDFYKISRFIKSPKNKSVSEEIKATKKFLTDLRARFPEARIIYKKGNHEDRMDTYIMSQAAEIYDLLEGLLELKLGLSELKIEYKPDFFRIGRLWHLHGHEKPSGGYNPEHICNVIFPVVLDHFIVGHYHRCQTKPFKSIDNKVYWGGALGYLAGEMDYAKINKWSQGVGLIEYGSDGFFKPEIRSIVNGEVY